MSGAAPTPSPAQARGMLAAMLAAAVFAAAISLSQPLLAVLMTREGWSGGAIGISAAMTALGTIAMGPLAARGAPRVGPARWIALCLATAALAALSIWIWPGYAWGLVARFLLGLATGGVFVAAEYWIVAVAPAAARGRLVARYALLVGVGFVLGPSLYALIGPDGFAPFAAIIAVAALAAAPIALARGGEPDGGGAGEPREGAAAPSPWRFFHRDATLTWAIILVGAFEFGMLGMTPVWGDRLGLGPGVVEGVLIAFAAGGLAAQPLIGWAADRLPARPCLAALAALCLASAAAAGPASDAAAAGAAGGETALYALFLLWGGAAIGLYTVALTELGARHAGATLAAGAAAFAIAYGLGALAAPPLIGALMDGAGPIGLPACLIGLTLVYLALLAAPRRAARA